MPQTSVKTCDRCHQEESLPTIIRPESSGGVPQPALGTLCMDCFVQLILWFSGDEKEEEP